MEPKTADKSNWIVAAKIASCKGICTDNTQVATEIEQNHTTENILIGHSFIK